MCTHVRYLYNVYTRNVGMHVVRSELLILNECVSMTVCTCVPVQ